MRINHNIQALNTYKQLTLNQNKLSKHLERLSSGLRINRAADDAAGLAISEKMRSQIRGLKVADRNSMDGISMLQTAEGALGEVHSILQRMRELSVQAANGSLSDDDRKKIQSEIDQLTSEIDRIADTTNFNGKKLLSGNMEGNVYLTDSSNQIVNNGGGQFIGTTLPDEELYMSFLQHPTAGSDNLKVQGVEINFVSGNAVTYNSPPTASEIGVDGKTTEEILSDIKGVLDTAKTTDAASVDEVADYHIAGNALVLKADTGGIPIEYNDPDYEPRPDEAMSMDMQIGANEEEIMNIQINNMDTASLGIAMMADHITAITNPGDNAEAGISLLTAADAEKAIALFSTAISKVTNQRSNLGAYENRLEHTVTNLDTTTLNLTEAESRIRDADMALEMTGFTQANIVNQAATAMLAQANQMPQGVLQLLQ